MQAPSGSQKAQRRSSPMEDPEMAKPSHTTSNSSTASRSTSGPGKSYGKRKDPQTQLSQIEKSVTQLLVATKQLLETLTLWSRHQATEGEVSDVYVRLGYEFNIACRAFSSIGVSTDDLGPVPDLLRNILEETLSQDASPQSLDQFLPRIRDIIINLLHGLKKKQSKLRSSRAREGPGSEVGGQPVRQQSTNSQNGTDSDFGNPTRASNANRVGSQTIVDKRSTLSQGSIDESDVPQRITPNSNANANAPQEEAAERASRRTSVRDSQYDSQRASASSLSTTTGQSLPVVLPEENKGPLQRISLHEEPPPPPPPPKQQDALAALQRGGELERRASRRYSAYQISKHLGASPGGVPMIPPPQHSPIPNRGRDVRESLNAVRQRASFMGRQRSQLFQESSPSQAPVPSSRISEGTEGSETAEESESGRDTSPNMKTLGEKSGPPAPDSAGLERPAMSGTVNGPPPDSLSFYDAYGTGSSKENAKPQRRPSQESAPQLQQGAALEEQQQFIPEQSPQPGKELTLFLQYKSRIKKIILPGGSNDLTIPRLQLAFIEKFAWNTHNNGVDLPEIYIQDSVSGVRHELEDLSDIKDRSVLVLNIEPLDEVKRHIDEGLGGLRKMFEGVRTQLDDQQLAISQVSDRQQDAAKEAARVATAPPARNGSFQVNGVARSLPATKASMHEVQTLRRDLAVIRQTFSSFTTDVQSSMSAVRAKAEAVKAKAVDVAVPALEGDSGRAYVNNGKKLLGDDSDELVNKVDDLQDIVEDLRKDVVNRGVRPLARQLESATKDISDAIKELKKMQDYVKREKPTWTKIWEKELELVCNDREFLTMQEELIADLDDDLEKATQTMRLVEQATKQQNLQSTSPGATPSGLRGNLRSVLNIDNADIDPTKAKDGVLGQVKALQPNHEGRLEAIERAERFRQRELESRRRDAAFTKELGSFVDEGKLKKSGGVEEAERLRRTKDERNLKEEWEDQQRRKAERVKKRGEERARQAAAAQAATEDPNDDIGVDEDNREQGMHDAQPGEELEDRPSSQRGSGDLSPRKSWLPSFLSGSS